MKDIYELLNDIDIDEKELEEIEASEIEKEKVKRNVKQSMRTKKKMKKLEKRRCCCIYFSRRIGCHAWHRISDIRWRITNSR